MESCRIIPIKMTPTIHVVDHNLGYATLHLDSSEKLKFEIYGKMD